MPNIYVSAPQLNEDQYFSFSKLDPASIFAGNTNGTIKGITELNGVRVDMSQADEDGNVVYTGQGGFFIIGSDHDDIFHPNQFAPGFGDDLNPLFNKSETSRTWLKANYPDEDVPEFIEGYINNLFEKGYQGIGRIEAGAGDDKVYQDTATFGLEGGPGEDTFIMNSLNYERENQGEANAVVKPGCV